MNGDALSSYSEFQFESDGSSHRVFVSPGDAAPPVVVMHELPGMSRAVVNFANRLAGEGYRVYLPLLFGDPLQSATMENYRRLCISQEFGRLKAGVSAPITNWLRALGRKVSTDNGNRNIGVIGMCLTGAFAIPLILDAWTAAPVASQPAVPFSMKYWLFGIGRGPWMRELNVADADIGAAAARCRDESLTLLAFRFDSDRICPRERMDRLRDEFHDRLDYHELHDDSWWGRAIRPAHAVLTEEYDRAGDDAPDDHPTRVAYRTLLAFLRERLT
jgi:hypothetical protein